MGLLRIIHLFIESKHLKFSHRSSKGTLSKPLNLMRRGLSGVIGNIIKQKTNEVVMLLSATNDFHTNVGGVVVGRNVTSEIRPLQQILLRRGNIQSLTSFSKSIRVVVYCE